jgi:hypothetical protein
MGLFDEIRVEQILPGEYEITDTWYQTKSLENVMARYVITAKGELYEEKWDWEWIEDPNHWLKGYINRIEGTYRRDYLTDFHGDIIFYTSKPMDENRMWRDYHARFTEGKLSRIWFEDKQY